MHHEGHHSDTVARTGTKIDNLEDIPRGVAQSDENLVNPEKLKVEDRNRNAQSWAMYVNDSCIHRSIWLTDDVV